MLIFYWQHLESNVFQKVGLCKFLGVVVAYQLLSRGLANSVPLSSADLILIVILSCSSANFSRNVKTSGCGELKHLEKFEWKLSHAFVVRIFVFWHAHRTGGYLAALEI